LRDDVGTPLASAAVTISVRGADGEALHLGPASACDGPPSNPPRGTNETIGIETDRLGAFCVRVAPDRLPSGALLRLEHVGSEGLDAARRDVPIDGLLGAPLLTWDPRPDALDLDTPRLLVHVVASAPGTDAEPVPAAGVALALEDETGRRLGAARSDGSGRAFFDVASSDLGAPGPGELVARTVAGAGSHEPLRAPVLRHVRVSLVVAQPAAPVVPHDGYVFDVGVETSRGAARSGAVEARVGGEPVGAAGVRDGRARVPVAFDVPAATTLPITFQYLPDDPSLRPGAPTLLQVSVRPPSLWRRAPLLALVALLALWTARGWRRAPAPPRPEVRPLPSLSFEGREGIIEGPSTGGEGWRGQIIDAHSAEPLAGARVAIVRRSFQGERPLAEATSDAQGMFALDVPFEPHATLVVEGPLHRRLERPSPKPGHVIVALVARRRALLDALVRAARRAGGPWKTDPTPAQVAHAAQIAGQAPTVDWARAVEGAAFGPEPVDAVAEAHVVALAPESPPSIGPPLRPH
jgi:hypothetical protein